MKNFPKIFLFSLGSALLALPALRAEETASAGGPPPPPEHHPRDRKEMKEMGEKMAQELGLSAEQKTQMKALAKEQKMAADALRADTTISPEQKKEKLMQLHQNFKERRKALLTPEQQKKAQELRANHREGRSHHQPEGAPAPEAK